MANSTSTLTLPIIGKTNIEDTRANVIASWVIVGLIALCIIGFVCICYRRMRRRHVVPTDREHFVRATESGGKLKRSATPTFGTDNAPTAENCLKVGPTPVSSMPVEPIQKRTSSMQIEPIQNRANGLGFKDMPEMPTDLPTTYGSRSAAKAAFLEEYPPGVPAFGSPRLMQQGRRQGPDGTCTFGIRPVPAYWEEDNRTPVHAEHPARGWHQASSSSRSPHRNPAVDSSDGDRYTRPASRYVHDRHNRRSPRSGRSLRRGRSESLSEDSRTSGERHYYRSRSRKGRRSKHRSKHAHRRRHARSRSRDVSTTSSSSTSTSSSSSDRRTRKGRKIARENVRPVHDERIASNENARQSPRQSPRSNDEEGFRNREQLPSVEREASPLRDCTNRPPSPEILFSARSATNEPSIRFDADKNRVLLLRGVDFEPRNFNYSVDRADEPPVAAFLNKIAAATVLDDLAGMLRAMQIKVDVVRTSSVIYESLSVEFHRWRKRLEINRCYLVVEQLINRGVPEELLAARTIDTDMYEPEGLHLQLPCCRGAPYELPYAFKNAFQASSTHLIQSPGRTDRLPVPPPVINPPQASSAHLMQSPGRTDRSPLPPPVINPPQVLSDTSWPTALAAASKQQDLCPLEPHREEGSDNAIESPRKGRDMSENRMVKCTLDHCGKEVPFRKYKSHLLECVKSRQNIYFDVQRRRIVVMQGLEFSSEQGVIDFKMPKAASRTLNDIAHLLNVSGMSGAHVVNAVPDDSRAEYFSQFRKTCAVQDIQRTGHSPTDIQRTVRKPIGSVPIQWNDRRKADRVLEELVARGVDRAKLMASSTDQPLKEDGRPRGIHVDVHFNKGADAELGGVAVWG